MTSWIENLRDLSERRLDDLRRAIELMESGSLETHQKNMSTGRIENTTKDTIAHYRSYIAELEEVLEEIKADEVRSP